MMTMKAAIPVVIVNLEKLSFGVRQNQTINQYRRNAILAGSDTGVNLSGLFQRRNSKIGGRE